MHEISQARHRKRISKARKREIKKQRTMKRELMNTMDDGDYDDKVASSSPLEKIEEEIIDDGGVVTERPTTTRCVVM
jgi:hypothetical protein